MAMVYHGLSGFERHSKVTIGQLGHDSYGAGGEWREGQHDDLVLAVALAVWFGEHGRGGSTLFESKVIHSLDVNAGLSDVFGNTDLASIDWDELEASGWLTKPRGLGGDPDRAGTAFHGSGERV